MALPAVFVWYDVQELARLKADYVSAEVADTIRNLRHHIVITDRYSHTHSPRQGLGLLRPTRSLLPTLPHYDC